MKAGPLMPWKNPDNWLAAEIMAPILSFVLALLRTMYENSEPSWVRRLLESVICGMITLSAGYAIDAMGVASEWKYAVAGTIGFLGAEYIRSVIQKIINKRV